MSTQESATTTDGNAPWRRAMGCDLRSSSQGVSSKDLVDFTTKLCRFQQKQQKNEPIAGIEPAHLPFLRDRKGTRYHFAKRATAGGDVRTGLFDIYTRTSNKEG
jgi:hypothetical protein